VLPECFETSIIQYVHTTLGHAGVDKCVWEINQSFHLKNVGRKVRKRITSCDICQRVRHSNWSLEIQERSRVSSKPAEFCAIDLYGPLPTGRGVRYILVCFEVFTKYVKLYPIKTATTKSCLNKLVNHYFVKVVKPQVVLSDNGTQFQSPLWKGDVQKHGVEVRYSAIRHAQSNPSERRMREISKLCRIYCQLNHRKWAELIPHTEHWLNNTVASATLYTSVELLFGAERDNLFQKCLPKIPKGEMKHEEVHE
jgi:transposase InsO family protein